MDRQAELDALHAVIEACVVCRDRGRSIKKPRVMRRGGTGARIFAIGQAPGAAAMREELAFAGYSIARLLKWFADAGFVVPEDRFRSEVYLTSIVKCSVRPDTRRERFDLWAECHPFLWRQLEIVEPALVLILGAEPLIAIFQDRGIKLEALVGSVRTTSDIFAGQLFPPITFETKWLVLPHPSGLSRTMNDSQIYARAIEALRSSLMSIGFSA